MSPPKSYGPDGDQPMPVIYPQTGHIYAVPREEPLWKSVEQIAAELGNIRIILDERLPFREKLPADFIREPKQSVGDAHMEREALKNELAQCLHAAATPLRAVHAGSAIDMVNALVRAHAARGQENAEQRAEIERLRERPHTAPPPAASEAGEWSEEQRKAGKEVWASAGGNYDSDAVCAEIAKHAHLFHPMRPSDRIEAMQLSKIRALEAEVAELKKRLAHLGANARGATLDRERLGQLVREIWIAWAKEQPNPKPSWLVPWEQLSEPDREVDRRIGEGIARVAEVAELKKRSGETCTLDVEGLVAHLKKRSATPGATDEQIDKAARYVVAKYHKHAPLAPPDRETLIDETVDSIADICIERDPVATYPQRWREEVRKDVARALSRLGSNARAVPTRHEVHEIVLAPMLPADQVDALFKLFSAPARRPSEDEVTSILAATLRDHRSLRESARAVLALLDRRGT